MESKEGKENGWGSWENVNFKDLEMGEKIGGGGVGVIYKGMFGSSQVALKTLFDTRVDDKLKKEYMDELLVMSKLQHSNIVQFMGACMTPPNLCFIMELCDTSLYTLLHVDRGISFTERDAVQTAIDIGSAIEYLHALRPTIIHRDIKSHNVLRASNGAMKLCDFGLVNSKITTAGTPAYMAPELLENKTFNKLVDTYAFGVLMCECVSREMPFYMVDVMEIRDRVLRGDRPRIAATRPRLSKLIQSCWADSPTERLDFTAIVDELLEISDALPEQKFMDAVVGGAGDALDGLLGFK
jgi:serine/threonine protein kinase